MSESPRVFISHIHSDSDWVRSFVDQLLSAGQENVWCFEREVAVGEPWADKVENGLRSSEYIVIVVSPGSINSSWFNFELGVSLGMGKKVIPIVAMRSSRSAQGNALHLYGRRTRPERLSIRCRRRALP